MAISDTYNKLKTRVKKLFSLEDYEDKIPKAGDDKVANYISDLWEDGKKFFENAFAATKDTTRFGFTSPEDFYDACIKLESGRHYEVYPSRTTSGLDGTDNTWKQELIDNEIQKQIRAKKNHITAGWHDIVISPNIVGINEIFDQERKATSWSENVREWVSYAQNFGDVTVRSILDKTNDPRGVATEITCEPGSVFRTPESKSFAKKDGCWYAVHGQKVNDTWVRKNYPKFDMGKGEKSGMIPKFLQIDKNYKDSTYTHTKMLNKLEAFIDDESLEEIPFDKNEFDQRIGQIMSDVQEGKKPEEIQVVAKPEDNHKKYVEAYLEWLKEKTDLYEKIATEAFNNSGNLLPEDTQLIHSVMGAIEQQVNEHEGFRSQETDLPDGKRKKYPFGRYVVTLNGILAEDNPNPYENEWRKMFHVLMNEKVPGRRDGRGDIEILWKDNQILDTMLSRFADDALLATHKKPWLHVTEKATIDKDGYSTNPLKIGYYSKSAPTFPTGQANTQYLECYKIVKNGTKESLSINQVTRGESSFSGESGSHAEALLNQNVVQVAGELNQNLNDFIEDVVECRIEFWKKFYTEPRIYIIDGQQVELVLAEHLRQTPVEENGQIAYKDVGAIEVAVRPDSNFPNKDDAEINILAKLSSIPNEDGVPIIPPRMILDYIAKKFPSLSSNGKYRQDSKIMALGKQAMAQQQAEAEKQAEIQKKQGEPLDAVKRKVQNRITTAAAQQITGQDQGQNK